MENTFHQEELKILTQYLSIENILPSELLIKTKYRLREKNSKI